MDEDFSLMRLPAVCEDCGTVFPSGYTLGGSATMWMEDCTSGPCGRCGGTGLVPNGAYTIVERLLAYDRNADMAGEDIAAAISLIGTAIGPGAFVDVELLRQRLPEAAPSVAQWVLTIINSETVSNVRDWLALIVAVLAYHAATK